MVVQHNMQAANANRMLNVTTSAQSKRAQRSFHQVTESTVQQMMQLDLQFLRR